MGGANYLMTVGTEPQTYLSLRIDPENLRPHPEPHLTVGLAESLAGADASPGSPSLTWPLQMLCPKPLGSWGVLSAGCPWSAQCPAGKATLPFTAARCL